MKLAFVLIAAVVALVVAVMLLLPKDRLAAPPKTVTAEVHPCTEPVEATSCSAVAPGPAPVPLPPVIHRVDPVLPDLARKAGVHGVVILRAGIRRDGSVGGVCVLKPLPCGLADAAVAAVRQWRFAPQRRDVVANVEIRF